MGKLIKRKTVNEKLGIVWAVKPEVKVQTYKYTKCNLINFKPLFSKLGKHLRDINITLPCV